MTAFGPRTFAAAVALTVLTSAGGLLTTASKAPDGTYPYNFATVPLIAEAIKLTVSAVLLQHARHTDGEPPRITLSPVVASLYVFPGLLYWVHNNMQFMVLKFVDPTTYQVLGNLKIVTTGLLFRLLLRRLLSPLQWVALLLLAVGTTMSQVDGCKGVQTFAYPTAGYLFGLTSALLSAFGAVYTEWVLKRSSDSLHWQNVQLYSCGVAVNALGVAVAAQRGTAHGWRLTQGFNAATWVLTLNLAFSGLLVSWIMKFADSILKVYSTSMAMLLSMVASVWLFGLNLSLQLVLGVITACVSLFIYYLPPQILLSDEDSGKQKEKLDRDNGGSRHAVAV